MRGRYFSRETYIIHLTLYSSLTTVSVSIAVVSIVRFKYVNLERERGKKKCFRESVPLPASVIFFFKFEFFFKSLHCAKFLHMYGGLISL